MSRDMHSTRIYLDHNATSPLREIAREAMLAWWRGPAVGNPSSVHAEGRAARAALEDARARIARALGAPPDGVVLTSGGSEANALALNLAARERDVWAAATEHPSLAREVERRGGRLLPVDASGRVAVETLADALDGHAGGGCVSIGWANHETGLVTSPGPRAAVARAAGAAFHTDASQVVGRLPIDVGACGADAVTIASHKLGGPVGIGALVLIGGARPRALRVGGEQEDGLRPGTEAVALALGFAAALCECVDEQPVVAARMKAKTNALRGIVRRLAPDAVIHTPDEHPLPNTLCVSFPGRPGSSLVQRLDLEGVAVSHGSACASGAREPSPVLRAMGVDEALARCAVRISVGRATSDDDVREFERRLARTLAAVTLRHVSS